MRDLRKGPGRVLPPIVRQPALPSWPEQTSARGKRPQSDGRGAGGTRLAQVAGAAVAAERINFSEELLDRVRQGFSSCGGSVELEQFARAVLGGAAALREVSGAAAPSQTSEAASIVKLFRDVDVHGTGTVSWEEVSNHLVERGPAILDEASVDEMKTYGASDTQDKSRHESVIEKITYIQQLDALVCTSSTNHDFRIYDPRRISVKSEVSGHRSTVTSCCYVNTEFEEIATASADLSIRMWNPFTFRQTSKIVTKEVQLCLAWPEQGRSVFGGSEDGSVCRFDLGTRKQEDSSKLHEAGVNDLLFLGGGFNQLASASADGTILSWDLESMQPYQTFKAHKRGVLSLAFSTEYNVMLSAGADSEPLVWNPYVGNMPIFRLKGHASAMVGVTIVPGTPQILSLDTQGEFRLWDMRNYLCVQAFTGRGGDSQPGSFCAMAPYKRIAAGGKRIALYDYMDGQGSMAGGGDATEPGDIVDALYDPQAGNFYTMSDRSMKIWSAGGAILKVMREVVENEITAACLSENGCKLYLGNSQGEVAAHSVVNGKLLTKFEAHGGDVSCLIVCPGSNFVFSGSCDGTLKCHSDEGPLPPLMRKSFNLHKGGITCMSCSPKLHLLASGSTDTMVNFYDMRSLAWVQTLPRFNDVIVAIDFFAPQCLLVVADESAAVSLWRTRPHANQWTCVYRFSNLEWYGPHWSEVKLVSAVCFSSFEDRSGRSPCYLYTADSNGGLRCWSLSETGGLAEGPDMDIKALFHEQRQRLIAPAPKSRPLSRSSSTPSLSGGARPSSAGASTFLTAARLVMSPTSPVGQAPENAPQVRLVSDLRTAHAGAIVRMRSLGSPPALVTCGADHLTQVWGSRLELYGSFVSHGRREFRFPFDPGPSRARLVAEAETLLARLAQVDEDEFCR